MAIRQPLHATSLSKSIARSRPLNENWMKPAGELAKQAQTYSVVPYDGPNRTAPPTHLHRMFRRSRHHSTRRHRVGRFRFRRSAGTRQSAGVGSACRARPHRRRRAGSQVARRGTVSVVSRPARWNRGLLRRPCGHGLRGARTLAIKRSIRIGRSSIPHSMHGSPRPSDKRSMRPASDCDGWRRSSPDRYGARRRTPRRRATRPAIAFRR